jgi:hypothetical protein
MHGADLAPHRRRVGADREQRHLRGRGSLDWEGAGRGCGREPGGGLRALDAAATRWSPVIECRRGAGSARRRWWPTGCTPAPTGSPASRWSSTQRRPGFPLADPVIGLVITVAILLVLRDAAREVYRRLMDAVEPVLVDQAEHAIGSVSRGRSRDRRPLAGARAQPPRWGPDRGGLLRVAGRRPPPQPPGRASSRPRRTAAHSGDDHVEPVPHDSADAHDLISHHHSLGGIAPEDVMCGATPDQAVRYRDRPHGVLDRHACRGVIKRERPPHGSGREAPELPR